MSVSNYIKFATILKIKFESQANLDEFLRSIKNNFKIKKKTLNQFQSQKTRQI